MTHLFKEFIINQIIEPVVQKDDQNKRNLSIPLHYHTSCFSKPNLLSFMPASN